MMQGMTPQEINAYYNPSNNEIVLPAAIFILKDFMDAMPASYEESARVFGASSFQGAAIA